MSYEKELRIGKDLATEAQALVKQYQTTDYDVDIKEDGSSVTIVDETINRRTIEVFKELLPEYGLVGEEQSWQADKPKLGLCDPVDDTDAFTFGVRTSMYSLGFSENGKIMAAITADLARIDGSAYIATADGGAFMDGQQLAVSGRTIDNSRLLLPKNVESILDARELYLSLIGRCALYYTINGSVYKGMAIASGLADGMIWPGTMQPWDIAAVQLIVTEAGGKITDLNGEPYDRYDEELTRGVVVSNGVIHDDLLEIASTAR